MVKNKKDVIAKIAPFLHSALHPYSLLHDSSAFPIYRVESVSPPLESEMAHDLLWPTEHSRRDLVPAASRGPRRSCMLLLASLEACHHSSNEPELAFWMMRGDVAQSPPLLRPRASQSLDVDPPPRLGQSPLSHQLTMDESVSPATTVRAGRVSRTLKLTRTLVSINKWYLFQPLFWGWLVT